MPNINKLPATAGIIRFNNHIPAVVAIMPSLFADKMPKSCKAASPLNPKSATGIVGKIANTRKRTLMVQIAVMLFNCTLKICNITRY